MTPAGSSQEITLLAASSLKGLHCCQINLKERLSLSVRVVKKLIVLLWQASGTMEVGEGVASLSAQLPHLSSLLLGTRAAMIPAGKDYKPLEFHLYGRECPECDKRCPSCLTCWPDPRARPRADGCHATSPGLLESPCKEQACPLSPSPSASGQKLGPRRKENPTCSVQRYILCDYLAVRFVTFCFLKVSRKDRFQHSCRR